jgi:hypothetical protein
MCIIMACSKLTMKFKLKPHGIGKREDNGARDYKG